MLPIIATPKYELIIPSTGTTVTYRPYVVKEEKILLIALESQDDIAIEKSVQNICKACIETNIDFNKLTNFDLEFIFITLRSKSVGEGIKLDMKCEIEDCEGTTPQKVNLDEVVVSNLDGKVDHHVKINDTVSLDLRWMGINDKLTKAMRSTDTDAVINSVAMCIETIYSGEETFTAKDSKHSEVVAFVESLNNDQFGKVIEFMEKAPALEYKMEYECKECGHKQTRELRGLVDFFI